MKYTLCISALCMSLILSSCTSPINPPTTLDQDKNQTGTMVSQEPQVFRVALADGSFPFADYFGKKHFVPARFQAVIGVPQGSGPFPVVFVVHGNGPACVWKNHTSAIHASGAMTDLWQGVCADEKEAWKNLPDGIKDPYNYAGPDYLHSYMGFGYLVRELAKAGMIAISIDANPSNNPYIAMGAEPNQMEMMQDIYKAYRSFMGDLNAGKNHGLALPVDLTGKVDLSRIGIVGHSVNGELIHELDNTGVAGIVSLQAGGLAAEVKDTTDTLIIRGSCDEQTGPDAGLDIGQTLVKNGAKNVIDVSVEGIGHGMVNTAWSGSTCPGKATREQAETSTALATVSFFEGIFAKKAPTIQTLSGLKTTVTNMNTKAPYEAIESVNTPIQPLPYTDIKSITSSGVILAPFPDLKKIGEFNDY